MAPGPMAPSPMARYALLKRAGSSTSANVEDNDEEAEQALLRASRWLSVAVDVFAVGNGWLLATLLVTLLVVRSVVVPGRDAPGGHAAGATVW